MGTRMNGVMKGVGKRSPGTSAIARGWNGPASATSLDPDGRARIGYIRTPAREYRPVGPSPDGTYPVSAIGKGLSWTVGSLPLRHPVPEQVIPCPDNHILVLDPCDITLRAVGTEGMEVLPDE